MASCRTLNHKEETMKTASMNMSICAGGTNPNVAAYEAELAELQAIPRDEVKTPSMPVDTFLQEAENLETWCRADRSALEAAGLPWSLVEALPRRAGALREAESRWFLQRFTREEAQQQWTELAPGAYDLRDTLLHAMRYAYRASPDLTARVAGIAAGNGHDDMIQDLNDAAVLGREHPEQLAAIGFDLERLDRAAALSAEMADLLAEAISDRETDRAVKTVRDRAYTHLKRAVDEVRACGQYVFWRDPDRLFGYASAYHRHQRRAKPATDEAAPPAAVEQ
jgi:hypothetical protein